MNDALSAHIVPMAAYASRRPASVRIGRVVANEPRAVKTDRAATDTAIDLLRPSFEGELAEGPRLWLRRLLWRRRLRDAFRSEADAVLRDFGLTREHLAQYVARSFWRK